SVFQRSIHLLRLRQKGAAPNVIIVVSKRKYPCVARQECFLQKKDRPRGPMSAPVIAPNGDSLWLGEMGGNTEGTQRAEISAGSSNEYSTAKSSITDCAI